MITLKDLSKSYGRNTVLKDINIRFEKGKVYGIIGRNGAGKTTLFRCIADLETYEGEVVSELNPLKEHLGFLMTEPFFFPKITGREYIIFLCNARGKNISTIGEKNIFDLPLNRYVATYSTGEKKKLSLLGILLQENQCFVLDEPWNGVDIYSNIIILEVIKTLKSLGKTIIISSHILSTLTDVCDEIYLLKDGFLGGKITPEMYNTLDVEMKDISVGGYIERLGLK